MLDLCQKLHICAYDRHNYFGNRVPFGDPWPPVAPKVEMLESPLICGVAVQCRALLQTELSATVEMHLPFNLLNV